MFEGVLRDYRQSRKILVALRELKTAYKYLLIGIIILLGGLIFILIYNLINENKIPNNIFYIFVICLFILYIIINIYERYSKTEIEKELRYYVTVENRIENLLKIRNLYNIKGIQYVLDLCVRELTKEETPFYQLLINTREYLFMVVVPISTVLLTILSNNSNDNLQGIINIAINLIFILSYFIVFLPLFNLVLNTRKNAIFNFMNELKYVEYKLQNKNCTRLKIIRKNCNNGRCKKNKD